MFLGIFLVQTILCQLWAIENIGALFSFAKNARTLVVAEESSPKKESGETERLANVQFILKLFSDRCKKKRR